MQSVLDSSALWKTVSKPQQIPKLHMALLMVSKSSDISPLLESSVHIIQSRKWLDREQINMSPPMNLLPQWTIRFIPSYPLPKYPIPNLPAASPSTTSSLSGVHCGAGTSPNACNYGSLSSMECYLKVNSYFLKSTANYCNVACKRLPTCL